MKTYFKTFARMFLRHKARLISVILMVLVSIGFCAGIGMATDKMNAALDDVYREKRVPDLTVKSTRETGFTKDEISALKARYGDGNLLFGASLEFEQASMSVSSEMNDPTFGDAKVSMDIAFQGVGEGVTRVYFYDMPPSDVAIGKLEVKEEIARPEDLGPDVYDIYAERETAQLLGYAPGTRLSADITYSVKFSLGEMRDSFHADFFVRGVLENAMHMATRLDISLQFQQENGDQKELESIFYLCDHAFFEDGISPPTGDAYVYLPREYGEVLSSAYQKQADAEKEALEALLGGSERKAEILTLADNFSFASYHEYANKIGGIGYVMMAVFLAVTLLVVLSTMIRLLDEERGQIACLTTLGYSPLAILSKYILFAFVGTILGAVGGYFAGMGLSYIIYINFDWNYSLPPYPARMNPLFSLVVAGVIVAATILATFFAGLRKLRERPAELLRPRPPRAGRKVFLERIPILWNRLSFKYKSSLRNVLRYLMRFFMTVVACMASTALVLAGLAVLDCCLFQDIGTAAMIGVGIIVVFFAALLDFVVIYTLTNINISERERELATLMVLGYHDREVTGYVYREIYMTGAIGTLLGLPFGCLVCYFIFKVMGFGSLAGIHWWLWILTPLLSMFFTFLVTLMLSVKIKKIDMNASLKAIE